MSRLSHGQALAALVSAWDTAAAAAAANQPPASAATTTTAKILASPLWKLPHKYKRVTIRHTMGTTQKHVF